MDSFEWNRLAGWVLAAAIAVLGLSIVSGILYTPETAKTKGYKVEGVVEETTAAAGPAEVPITMMMAEAQPARGEAAYKKCTQCHVITAGGPNGIGPNLYGVVGRPVASHAGFAYSDALKAHGGAWTWDALSAWLANPKKYIPGNKMAFAGISDPKQRADLLAYLNSQSASPLPLPAPGPAPGVPTAEPGAEPPADAKPAPAPGKAPDTAQGQVTPATAAQPQGNRAGDGAADVTGDSDREVEKQ